MVGSRSRVLVRVLSLVLLATLAAAPLPVAGEAGERIRVRVYVLDFDPLMDNGQPLTVDRGWGDPFALDAAYVADVTTASAGIVEQRIVKTSVVRDFPVKLDGFKFTNAEYIGCLLTSPPTDPCKALIDYQVVLSTPYDAKLGSACDALRKNRIDEVWLWGGPWFGYQEFNIGTPHSLCPDVTRTFAVMGFNYERGVGEMVHDLGHRAEFLIPASIGYAIWDRFDGQRQRYAEDFFCPIAPDATHPEVAPPVGHAGNVHFPPNAYCHYQYDRDYPVLSDADDWGNYPNLTGAQSTVNASTWGGTQEGFMVWWLGRFPRNPGSTSAGLNDWWRYVYPSGRTHPAP
jgi:hypothetical protein